MKLERFIPVSRKDLQNLCVMQCDDNIERQAFEQLCELLSATIHFQYHHLLEALKDNYAPFDPNADVISLSEYDQQTLQQKQSKFAELFAQVLDAANFEKITDQDLHDAMHETSLFDVRLAVEFDDFEQVVFYRRGESEKTETLRRWWGLKKQPIRFTHYDRVAVYIKFKDAAYFQEKKKIPLGFTPGATIIKLFQNVPKADLEMLFPNSEVKMRKIDKIVIGASAMIGGIVVLVTKLGASLVLLATLFAFWLGWQKQSVAMTQEQLVALIIGLGVFASFIFKEWSKFKNRKIRFMKMLADNLYFKNLTNNAGVFHSLIDAAEEEDVKEALLAYFFLLKSSAPMTSTELDQQIENWFFEQTGRALDFEVGDALQKLETLGLVSINNSQYQALPLAEAKTTLDKRWDNFFNY